MIAIKLALFLVLVYPLYIAETFGEIPYFLIGSYLLLDLFVAYYFLAKRKKHSKFQMAYECKAIIAFYATSLIFGLMVSNNLEFFLEKVFIGIQYAVLFVSVYCVVMEEKNADYIARILFAISFVYIVTAVARGNFMYERLLISETSNANTLGSMCFVCTGLALYPQKKGYLLRILSMVGVGLAFYAAVLSGSKKATIIVIVFILLYVIWAIKDEIRTHPAKVLILIVSVAALGSFALAPLEDFFVSSITFRRFLMSEDLDVGRLELYEDAWNVFLQQPLFGVGYQCFQFYSSSGLYAHSAYAETLACTGIAGMIPWLSGYIVMIIKAIKNVVQGRNNVSYRWVFIWVFCQVVLDFSSISYYNPAYFGMLGGIAALNMLNAAEANVSMEKRRLFN